MNIKELKDIIKDLPDDMEVGGSGHYCEFLDCFSVQIASVSIYDKRNKKIGEKEILNIDMEQSGPDPLW